MPTLNHDDASNYVNHITNLHHVHDEGAAQSFECRYVLQPCVNHTPEKKNLIYNSLFINNLATDSKPTMKDSV